MNPTTLELPRDLEAKLSALSERLSRSKADLIREALEIYLEKPLVPGSGSLLERAGDLVGALEGPGDLSQNGDRLDGFGE